MEREDVGRGRVIVALLIHARSHPDTLVGELCDLLAVPPTDPFSSELVAVPTRGIERWLTQRIASGLAVRTPGDGICANVEFPSPRRLIRDVLRSVPALAASIERWEGTALTRSVAAILESHLDESSLWLLARYISAPGADTPLGNGQRLRAARKIAGLFMRYARYRPDMIRAWSMGTDVGPGAAPLATSDQWQPVVWRLVREQIGVPALPQLLPAGLEPIRVGRTGLDIPKRLGVYGLTAFDPVDLDVLEAVAAWRDVHLFLLHPSPALWRRTAQEVASASGSVPVPRRTDDSTVALSRHPLLRSWAQESRELQLLLASRNATADVPDEVGRLPPTLLGALQYDIRANRAPTTDPVRTEDVARGDDRSIQIHVCHGARRQVEVLRDAILHVLAADRTLEPRDVVIMTPDLATFAPLLEAAFPSAIDRDDSDSAMRARRAADALPDLRVRIADRAPGVVNPLVRFTATVLDLIGSRLEAGTVRELTALSVVRQRFGFDGDTADAIAAVIDDADIRWGLDGSHRAEWSAGSNDERTWRRGLDRALAGVFYADSSVRTVDTIAPLDGVEGQDARPVGLLAQIVDRVVAVRDLLGRPRSHSEWGPAIAGAVRLLAAPAWGEDWQWSQLERLLEESFPPPMESDADPELSPAEARLVVGGWSEDLPSPLHFRTGDITVCTLVPMRSVPYRVVCLLGMDDERFPRGSRSDGDDLLVNHEVVGDVDRSAEDRQLLLDAVMAAGDHLIVTYSGRDELTNARYPPAVPIAELEDALHGMVGAAGLERIVIRHPLQPFSEVNFIAGRLGVTAPWAFDPMQLDGAVAVQRRKGRSAADPTPASALEILSEDSTEIVLDDLIRFFAHPAKRFLRTRLGFTIPERGEVPDDTLPVDLDGLGLWGVTDRLLRGLLDGHSIESLTAHELAADAMPPGALGTDDLTKASRRAVGVYAAAQERHHDAEAHIQFAGAVPVGDRAVAGSIAADPQVSRIDVVTPSALKGKQRLRAFLQLVFLTALDPSRPWSVLLIGRLDRSESLWTVRMTPLGDDPGARKQKADRLLGDLVDLYSEGLAGPIPLPVETGYAWQRNLSKGRETAISVAGDVWEKGDFAERRDPANQLLLPDLADMSELAGTGFPGYAARLWGPIIPLLREKKA